MGMSNTEDMFEKKTRRFRRAWFRGLRAGDVNRALAELEGRNTSLEATLATSEETARALGDRLAAADATFHTFEATIANIGALLSLAEERVVRVEQEAQADAVRIRAEAEQHARELEAEAEALTAQKQQILADLAALRAGLTAVAEQVRPATNVRTLPGRDSHLLPHAAGS